LNSQTQTKNLTKKTNKQMKKLLLTIGLLAAVAVSSSYGQGTVAFGNTGGTRVSTNSGSGNVTTGSGLVAPNSTQLYYYALFYSVAQTTVGGVNVNVVGTNGVYAFNAAGWVDGTTGGAYSTNAAVGRLQPSAPNTDGSASVSGLGGGSSAQMVVIGWSANIGTTIAALQQYLNGQGALYVAGNNGWVGESLVSQAITPGTLGSTSPSGIFGVAPAFIPGFVLGEVIPTPEPGTLALCALGGASLLMLRRKK
jgi:hypothetical protein